MRVLPTCTCNQLQNIWKLLRKKCMRHINFIDFQAIPTICIYDLISRIFTNEYLLVLVTRFYRAYSVEFVKTSVRREHRARNSRILFSNMLRWFKYDEANITQMRVVYFYMKKFFERLHKSGMHYVATWDYLNIICVSDGLMTY